jgi:hypothetical protein
MRKKVSAISIPDEVIIGKIYFLREKKVLLDKDLAALYQVTTSNFNKAVQRNMKRFPPDFMFQLTLTEFKNLIFQNGISSWGGTRKLPYAFTEQGVAMLSGILGSDRAIGVNIRIMRMFIQTRKTLTDSAELRAAIEEVKKQVGNNSKNIELVFQYLDELLAKKGKQKPRNLIGFKPSKRKN